MRWATFASDRTTAEHYRNEIELPFFRHHLKGQGAEPAAEATMFETGGNAWKTFDTWPPKDIDARTLYFQADGGLSFSAPAAASTDRDWIRRVRLRSCEARALEHGDADDAGASVDD